MQKSEDCIGNTDHSRCNKNTEYIKNRFSHSCQPRVQWNVLSPDAIISWNFRHKLTNQRTRIFVKVMELHLIGLLIISLSTLINDNVWALINSFSKTHKTTVWDKKSYLSWNDTRHGYILSSDVIIACCILVLNSRPIKCWNAITAQHYSKQYNQYVIHTIYRSQSEGFHFGIFVSFKIVSFQICSCLFD